MTNRLLNKKYANANLSRQLLLLLLLVSSKEGGAALRAAETEGVSHGV